MDSSALPPSRTARTAPNTPPRFSGRGDIDSSSDAPHPQSHFRALRGRTPRCTQRDSPARGLFSIILRGVESLGRGREQFPNGFQGRGRTACELTLTFPRRCGILRSVSR
jgi:hypothetical protein